MMAPQDRQVRPQDRYMHCKEMSLKPRKQLYKVFVKYISEFSVRIQCSSCVRFYIRLCTKLASGTGSSMIDRHRDRLDNKPIGIICERNQTSAAGWMKRPAGKPPTLNWAILRKRYKFIGFVGSFLHPSGSLPLSVLSDRDTFYGILALNSNAN